MVDVSPLQEYSETGNILQTIIEIGYIPVIMQPERTTYWNMDHFIRLHDIGCKFMGSLYSFHGYNGDTALLHSLELYQRGWYDYYCSGMEDTKVMHYSEDFWNRNDR